MSRLDSFIDNTQLDEEAVNYILRDGYTIDVLRSQASESENAGFDRELTPATIVLTVTGRIDPKGDKWIGLTDHLDCQVDDIWRHANVRDEQMHYIVKSVRPRIGGCWAELEVYTKWQI